MNEAVAHRDISGAEISVGARVAYFAGGRYDSVNIGEVVEIRKKVKVRIEKSSRTSLSPGSHVWADSDRIVVLSSGEEWEYGNATVETGFMYEMPDLGAASRNCRVPSTVTRTEGPLHIVQYFERHVVRRRAPGPWYRIPTEVDDVSS